MLSRHFRASALRFRLAANRHELQEKPMAAAPQLNIPVAGNDPTRNGFYSGDVLPAETSVILERARAFSVGQGLGYSGSVTPGEAFELVAAGVARLIDVRTLEERKFVGYVPDSVAVPWATGTAFTRNPRFIRELEGKARKAEVLLFFCRSGARSILAAEAATRAQFQHAYNVLEGFEGELDAQHRRGGNGGWRFRGLPWIQD
jgi:rhodanese-related sulfurtransferase